MKVEIEFDYAVGDFVCMVVSQYQDMPPKQQVIGRFWVEEFGTSKVGYTVRESSAYSAGLMQVSKEEIMPYPTPEFLADREKEREEHRVIMSEHREAFRAKRDAEKQAKTEAVHAP